MAEMMMFQPGKAFMDSYNQGKAGNLARIAMTDPSRRQSALADLAGLNPDAARALQSDFDEKDKADFADWAGTLVNVAPELQPKVYEAGVARFGDKFRRMGIEPPQDYKQALPAIQQWAGITPQQAPAKVQEAQWFAKQIGLDPAKDPQGYAEFMRQAAGYGGKGPKMSVAPDGTPYDAENFRVFRDGKWIDISPGAMGGQTPPQNDGQGSGQPISLEQINQIGARMRRDGGSVEEVNAWKEQQYALWELANGMGNSGAIGSTAGQAPPPVAASPAGPAAGASTVTQPAAIGQGRPLFAKPGSRPATPEEKAVYGIPPDVPAQMGTDGQISVINLPKNDAPAGYRYAANGALEFIPGGPADPANKTNAKDTTVDEKAAKGYLDRMVAAEKELDGLIGSGFQPNVRDFYTAGQGSAVNWLSSPKGQVWRQQQEDWVRAKLRRESGASIPPDEMDREIKTYFPQPGDSKAVIESKRRSRIMAQQQLKTMAGRANSSAAQPPAGGKGKYSVGQVLVINGKRYQVTGGDMNDPDLKELK